MNPGSKIFTSEPTLKHISKVERITSSWPILFIYLIFGFGALWHILNTFPTLMGLLTPVLMIGLSLLLVHDVREGVTARLRLPVTFWCLAIALAGFGVEVVGVDTGIIFGEYVYGSILGARLFGVPLVMASAWVNCVLSAAVVAARITPGGLGSRQRWLVTTIIAALLLTTLDVIMEPAAMKLDYWQWQMGAVPLQNYVAWFTIGLVLAAPASFFLRSGVSAFRLTFHAFFAQILYFLPIILLA